MWEQSLCESGPHARTHSLVSLLASASVQMMLLALAVILPLTRTIWMPYFAPPLPLAVPAPTPVAVRASVPAEHWRVLAAASEQPLKPLELAVFVAPPAPWPGVVIPGAIAGPALGLPASTATIATPPATPPASTTPVARGGDVEAALCLACPPPAYPAFARQAHVEGTVVLQAVIGADGRVAAVRVASGPALLAAAARRAVLGWRYRPLVLDGRAVAVACAITVRFTLN